MKIYTYTTLLLILAFLIIPETIHSQNFIRKRASNFVKSDVEVKRDNEGNPRMGRAATTLKTLRTEADSVESGKRNTLIGAAYPDPNINTSVVRRKLDGTVVDQSKGQILNQNEDATGKNKNNETESLDKYDFDRNPEGNRKVDPNVSGPGMVKKVEGSYSSRGEHHSLSVDSLMVLSSHIGDPYIFEKADDLILMDNLDRSMLKNYSITLGSFSTLNNADFVRRSFNALGERVIVVKNKKKGLYVAILASYDTQTEAIVKYHAFTKKYKEGNSRTRLIGKYGIPLDDMWILIKE